MRNRLQNKFPAGLPVSLFPFLLFLFFAPGAGTLFGEQSSPVFHPTMKYIASWLDNSLNNIQIGEKNGKPDTSYTWVQKDGNGLAVGQDGTCYATSCWDEAGKGIGIYSKDGEDKGMCDCWRTPVGEMGVAVDEKYIYAAARGASIMQRPAGFKPPASTILRWHLDGTQAPLDDPNMYPTFTGAAGGIVSFNQEIYVSDTSAGTIRVFDRETFAEKRSFPCDQPFRMTLDSGGKLWIIHRAIENHARTDVISDAPNTPAKIAQFDPFSGKPTGLVIDDVDGATALATTPDGLLLVAGPHQQVLKYNISGPKPAQVGAIGVKDGVYADPPGQMGPGRLVPTVWGVGCDAQGNIYVLSRTADSLTGIDLRAFSSEGTQKWQLMHQGFIDCVGIDPDSDGLDVYSVSSHYVLDPSKPPGQQDTRKGYTFDPISYDDGRIAFAWNAPIIRRLQGRLYMYLHPAPGPFLGIFRKGSAEVFIPSGLIDLAPEWLMFAKTGGHEHELDWPPQQPMVPAPAAARASAGATPPVDVGAPVTVKTRWQWRDTNGDGKIQPDEIQAMPDHVKDFGTINDSWVDLKGDIWLSGDKTSIWHMPLQGFDAQQNPIYDWLKAVKTSAPSDLVDVRRLIYDSDTDSMYLAGVAADTKDKIHRMAIGNVVICYQHWNDDAKRTIKWKLSLPPVPPDTDFFFPSFAVAGDRVFVLQRWWNRIWVFSNADAGYVGMITTTLESGWSGWCDMQNGISAFQRKDGSYFVFTEDDRRPKIRFYIIPQQPIPSPSLPLPSPTEL